MATPQFVDLLCNHVDTLNDLNSFLPIMTAMAFDIEELQNMIKCKIRTLSNWDAQRLAFDAMPINSLLPIDTVQHILSFNHFSYVAAVSKSFKKCFEQNQANILRSRKSIAEENACYFAPDLPFDDSVHQTYVVRHKGEPLMEKVKALGDGVIVHHDFVQCFNDVRGSPGARIFVQSGYYEMKLEEQLLQIENRDLQLIGIGENVEICFNPFHEDYGLEICGNSKVLIENISFRHNDQALLGFAAICLRGESIVWMDRCKTEGPLNLVKVTDNNNVCAHFKSCQFESWGYVLRNYRSGKIPRMMMLDCRFTNSSDYGCIFTKEPIKFIGNRFDGDAKHLYAGEEEGEQHVTNQSVFRGNVAVRNGAAHVLHGFHRKINENEEVWLDY